MSQLIPGLVSVTFRSLSPEGIIDLAAKTGLKSIEWGGDVHVPHGETKLAREVGHQTREAGLSIAAYGSYYRLGSSEGKGLAFEQVLETALALGAPTIRVWTGVQGSSSTSPEERRAIVADALRTADLARASGITLSLEYHANTLTDTRESVQRLLEEMANPGLEFLWQPAHGETLEQGVTRLRDICPRLRHVHVFHWWPTGADRQALIDGGERWKTYLEILKCEGRTMPCLLEFVRNDSIEQFIQDAATLRSWLGERQ